jgi:alkylhydroperoxidase family enzyme
MRLQPIEKPRGWKARLAYAYSKRRFGRVITPMKVVQARTPDVIPLFREIGRFLERGTILEPSLLLLLHAWTAGYNQCHFCLDITYSFAAQDPALLEKLWRVKDYETDPLFSQAERAALRYVEEVTRSREASDATFEALRRHFTDRAIVEITLANAIENFYNLINRPLGIESDGLCVVQPPAPSPRDQAMAVT